MTCDATWIFASAQSTSEPFIQIFPVPVKAISPTPETRILTRDRGWQILTTDLHGSCYADYHGSEDGLRTDFHGSSILGSCPHFNPSTSGQPARPAGRQSGTIRQSRRPY